MIGITNGFGTIYTADCDPPSEDDVRSGVSYNRGALTGNYVPANPTLYQKDEQYGSNGTEFTGTRDFSGTLAVYQLPREVVLVDGPIIVIKGIDI
jgi:hypothetical protein